MTLGVIGPAWIWNEDRSCVRWVGPHVITPETRWDARHPGWWRDEEGDHYLPPPEGETICADSYPLRRTATRDEVERAQDSLGRHLNRKPWLRGIGYAQNKCLGDPQPFALSVRVSKEEHRALVPPVWDGFPVETVVVGDIVPLGVGAPANPWWSLWVNLGGTGEWQFVGWLYVQDQDLAPGNPKAVVDRVTQGLADQLTSPTFGHNAGGTATSTATPGKLSGPPTRTVEWLSEPGSKFSNPGGTI